MNATTPVRVHLLPQQPPGAVQEVARDLPAATAPFIRPRGCLATQPDPAPQAPPAPPGAWSATWRASAWSACKELMAQATGATVGLWVRGRLAPASAPTAIAWGVGAAIVMGWMVYRAARLAAAAAGTGGRSSAASSLAMVALPSGAVAAACVSAARAGVLPDATAFLIGKLTQRCVRYGLSTMLADLGPSIDIIATERATDDWQVHVRLDWHRALAMTLPTVALCLAQEYAAPSPAAADATPDWEQALPFVLAVGLVEAARALGGTWALAMDARAQGLTVCHRPAGGLRRLGAHLASGVTLRDASDAAAMRQVIGVTADLVSVLVGQPEAPLRRAIFRTLRAELKALGEFRGPLVRHGRLALERGAPTPPLHQEGAPPARPAFTEPVPLTALMV